MEQKIQEIETLMMEFLENAKKNVNDGNKAAGLRARKNALTLTALLKEFRKDSVAANAK